MLVSCFSGHFESIIISGKYISIGDEVIGLREASSLLIQILPKAVLASEVPASRKVIDLLKFIHILKRSKMSSADIEVYIPLAAFLNLLEAIVLERIDYALILRT